ERRRNGTKPTILTPDALAALKERLKTPPDDGGLWTGPKVARCLAKFHGVQAVHDQRGWDALIAIGYSIQQPRPRHPEAASDDDRCALKKSLRPRRTRSSASIRMRSRSLDKVPPSGTDTSAQYFVRSREASLQRADDPPGSSAAKSALWLGHALLNEFMPLKKSELLLLRLLIAIGSFLLQRGLLGGGHLRSFGWRRHECGTANECSGDNS